jgi:23S rRNA (cytosine1962-C5)-methyltransferase
MLVGMSNSLITMPEEGYELIDSGNGRKLERFGEVILDRPDPQIIWQKNDDNRWANAHASFGSQWQGRKNVPPRWSLEVGGVRMWTKLAAFKHVGVFPEHVSNWLYIRDAISNAGRPISVLNVFGYTGGATIAALQGGASVCHVDASKTAIGWAKENTELSNVKDKPIRWILDDALSFLRREVRRGSVYDAVVMDPPSSGRGARGEVWKIEDDLPELIELVGKLLSEKPLFVILNGYAAGYSHYSYSQLLSSLAIKVGGKVISGELCIEEAKTGRLLPAGIYARIECKTE